MARFSVRYALPLAGLLAFAAPAQEASATIGQRTLAEFVTWPHECQRAYLSGTLEMMVATGGRCSDL
jgi:uncharacterized membrane protein